MNLHGIKTGYKDVQMFSIMHQCLQAYTNIYMPRGQILKLPQAWSKRKSSIALIVDVKMYVYSIFRVHKVYNVFKISIK